MKYKVLPSAAHNIGHSFMSALNYVGDDYVMSHIAFHCEERKDLGPGLGPGPWENAWEMPVECVVTIIDDRGKQHQGILRDRCVAEARSRRPRWLNPRQWFRRA